MKFLIPVIIVLLLLCLFPYFRVAFKRVSLMANLKKTCKKFDFKFFAVRGARLFGGINGATCDFGIVAHGKLFAVKLASSLSKKYFYRFETPERYSVKSLRFRLAETRFDAEYKPKTKRKYDFCTGIEDDPGILEKTNILLFNPVPGGVFIPDGSGEKEIWNGDFMGEAYLYNATGFLKLLESIGTNERA